MCLTHISHWLLQELTLGIDKATAEISQKHKALDKEWTRTVTTQVECTDSYPSQHHLTVFSVTVTYCHSEALYM